MSGPVVCFSGPMGAGKSTFSRHLTAIYGGARLNYDDYEEITQKAPVEIFDWIERGTPLEEVKAPGLRDTLLDLRRQGPVFYENPLGRAWEETADLIDFAVWIDVPWDLALSRKTMIFVEAYREQGRSVQELARWIAQHFDSYERIVRPCMIIQEERVRPTCDVVLENGNNLNAAKQEISRLYEKNFP